MEPHRGPPGDHCQGLFFWNSLCNFREESELSPLLTITGESLERVQCGDKCMKVRVSFDKIRILEHLLKKNLWSYFIILHLYNERTEGTITIRL